MLDIYLEMVLQIFAYTWQVMDRRDANSAQISFIANA